MPKKAKFVCGGGSMKVIAYGGAFEEFFGRGWKIDGAAGVSAGGIPALLLAAGYAPREMKELVKRNDFTRWVSGFVKLLESVAKLINRRGGKEKRKESFWKSHIALELMRRHYGISRTDEIKKWLRSCLIGKGLHPDLTFGGLKNSPQAGVRDFRILTCDINHYGAPRVFSAETTPDTPIADAVTYSMVLFPFYQLAKWIDPEDGRIHYQADGGFIDACPMDIFGETTDDFVVLGLRPSFGIVGKEPDTPRKAYIEIKGLIDVMTVFTRLALKSPTQKHLKEEVWNRIITIPAPPELDMLDFRKYGNDVAMKELLWRAGRKAASEYLDRWENVLSPPQEIQNLSVVAEETGPETVSETDSIKAASRRPAGKAKSFFGKKKNKPRRKS